MTERLVSVCCEASPVEEDAVSDGAGQCSRCKENTMFEPDTWTQDESARAERFFDRRHKQRLMSWEQRQGRGY